MTDFTPFANPTSIKMDEVRGFGVVQYGDDSKNVVNFYMKAILDNEASLEANTPIYKNVVYVTIHPPGERLNIVDRPAQDIDKRRWPMQWQQYTLNKTQMPEGTPVDILFPNHPAIAATLKSLGVYTVQQLANLSGNAIDTLGMGGQDYVTKAQNFLKEAGNTKEYARLKREIEARDDKIDDLSKQMKMAIKTIKELQAQIASIGPIDRSQQNLGHVPNYDAQKERIDANHPTKEIKTNKKAISLTDIENA